MFFNIRRKWSFHVVVLQGTSTKYAVTNIYNALVQLIAGAADYESSGRMQIILRIAYTTEMSGPHDPFSLCYSGRPW